MLEEYYIRINILRSNLDILKDQPEEHKKKLKIALENVTNRITGSDEELESAMKEFIKVFDEMGFKELDELIKKRSLSLRKVSKMPRQIISDVTIMSLKTLSSSS